MTTLWLDVTTTLLWRRPPVGIVRVETEIFKYLDALRNPTVRFCRFDLAHRSYHEVTAAEVHDVISRFHLSRPLAETTENQPAARRVAARAREALARLPTKVRQPMLGAAKKTEPALRRALHEYRLLAKSARETRARLAGTLKTITSATPPPDTARGPGPTPFNPGDVLISGGLDWDQKDRVSLYQLKRELGLKVVLFCYDMIPVLFPHLCVGEVSGLFARYFVDVAWCADEVLCISRSSQKDLLEFLRETGAPVPRTTVVKLGSNLPARTKVERAKPLVEGKYLLFVSTIERRKNHEVIYRAISHLVNEGRTDLPQIVFVGMLGWGVSDFVNDLKLDPRVRGRFTLLNHVSDAELAGLYAGAEFTLYPSLYEGWGLPLAESLAHGKFSLAANTSSLPEVGGPLVEYLDPWDSRKWAARIAYFLDHPEELAQREAAIREDYRAPTWAQTGQAVFSAATLLASSPPTVHRAERGVQQG